MVGAYQLDTHRKAVHGISPPQRGKGGKAMNERFKDPEDYCKNCENGTPELCLFNPGGDCMKQDFIHYTSKGEAGRMSVGEEAVQ